MGTGPLTVSVYEPHLSVGGNNVTIDFVGYPAIDVMAAIFGEDWREAAETIEFRALDGFVSRIDVARLQPGKAYVVFARRDRSDFSVDNKLQNETNVSLGPYYLVWDNIANPDPLAESVLNWPYQISEVALVNLSDQALLPTGLDVRYHEGADLAKAHCLNCHMINGYGGEKYAGNLSEVAKRFAERDFVAWVLSPSSVKDGTTMPALSHRMPEAERQRIAKALYDYLNHVPVLR